MTMKIPKQLYGALFLTLGSFALKAQEATLRFKNPLKAERKDELITLDRSFIEGKLGKKIPKNGLIMEGYRSAVMLQYDDLNQDGEWDKLAFVLSLNAAENLVLKLKLNPHADVKVVALAHVRQKRKLPNDTFGPSLRLDSVPAGQPNTDFSKSKLPSMLTEGPAWENDKVGFRIYMDVRNTKDIWGKTTSEMMMDKVGADPKLIYHNLAPWGMDILAVGKSLGAGSLALSVPQKGKTDTLVRLGGKNMGKIIYKMIADGPVRAVFQMEYPEWNVLGDGHLCSLTEKISIWRGQYFYQSEVSLNNAPKGASLITGIVNLKSSKQLAIQEGKTSLSYTFDQQSENKDNLGMAVMLMKKDFLAFAKTPNSNSDVLNTYTTKMKIPAAGKTVTFRYYACWEHSDVTFSTENDFRQFLDAQASAFGKSINVK
jgi:hypothetical protein